MRGVAIGRQRAAGVEAEPAHPQHARAGHRQRQAVRRHGDVRKAAALAEHQRADQRRHAGIDVHHDAAGEIHHAESGQPAAAPHPVRHRHVHQQQPQRAENHSTAEKRMRSAIAADDQRRRDDGEGHLEHGEQGFGDGAGQRVARSCRRTARDRDRR